MFYWCIHSFDSADTYNPNRWLSQNVLEQAYKDKKLIPFSGGKRDCLGKRFAMLEMRILMMSLIRTFKLELILEPEFEADLTIHAKEGIMIRTVERSNLNVNTTLRNNCISNTTTSSNNSSNTSTNSNAGTSTSTYGSGNCNDLYQV